MTELRDLNDYSEETVKKKRRFPWLYTVLLVVLVVLQLVFLVVAIRYQPTPMDRIESYSVTVTPRQDGTLDILYDIYWCALDEDEPLTWVTVGMANRNFGVYDSALSDTVANYWLDVEEDYVGLRLDLKRAYKGGETVHLTFKVNQEGMLCKNGEGYFYEFVPGWFNLIPVSRYEFKWMKNEYVNSSNGEDKGEYYLWSGELAPGGYDVMQVSYAEAAFEKCDTVLYQPFDDSGAYNELAEERGGVIVFSVAVMIAALIGELFIIDGYVSYRRGRGFLSGYGHRVHVYGRINPRYSRARAQHNASRGSRGGGGCACACACACAGGGRAGCSQKDTYGRAARKEHEG